MRHSPYPMIEIEEALDIILQEVKPLSPQKIPFSEALGLVLAEDVHALEAMPPFSASAVDGYALRAEDDGLRHQIGDQMAGYVADLCVEIGQAVKITTGAPVPAGANAVVMIENTDEIDGQLEVKTNLEPGANIRPVGVDIEQGQRVLAAGTILQPAEIGLLATVGQTTVCVYPRPVVGVMSTGDEIVPPQDPLQPGQIRDANRFTLMNIVRQVGATPLDLGIVRDQTQNLVDTIERGLAESNVLLTSGGVSMGDLDLVKPYLAQHGTLHFGRVNTKPGKPVTFGILQGKPFFAMPGFPVSALVSFEIFVRPALLKMAGHTLLQRPRRQVTLAHPVSHNPSRTEFQRVIITRQADGSLTASTTGPQGSGRLLSLHGANGLIVLPHGQGNFATGDVVEALVLDVIP